MNLISLQMKTCENFETNLENLKNLILSCKNESLILAPELALVGFAYDKMEEASIFSIKAIDKIKELSENKIIAITTIIKEDDKFYNRLSHLQIAINNPQFKLNQIQKKPFEIV